LTGRKVFARLAKTLGPAAVKGLDVAKALESLEEDFEFLCDTFAKHTAVTGGDYGSKAPQLDSIFDAHFVAKYPEMLQWLVFCLEVNFAGFFPGLGTIASVTSPSATE
jgi:hypothetical protein